MELPQYTVYVETPRLLFPKTLKLIFLALFLYLAVWLNFFFLKKPSPFIVNILIMIVIVLIVLVSTIHNYTKLSTYQYRFYSNRIEYYGEVQQAIMYSQIRSIQVNKNFFDVLFHTGTINLGGFSIKSIPNLNQVFFYVQKMYQMYGGGVNQQQYPQPQQSYYPPQAQQQYAQQPPQYQQQPQQRPQYPQQQYQQQPQPQQQPGQYSNQQPPQSQQQNPQQQPSQRQQQNNQQQGNNQN